ncbi:hypothetical protein [Kitasatospora sp. GAS1066B]|uniref:hypothetical protein n=1 Tax=Kitasatospora sp. GAS1066B TaxID=3156271 RepID=UPI003515CD4B
MRFTKTRKRATAAVLAAVAMGVIGVGSATSAQAAEGTWTVRSGGCVALEQIELQGGHDHMAIDPIADPSGCEFGIFNSTSGTLLVAGPAPVTHETTVYAGLGTNLTGCLIADLTGTRVCDPLN